MPGPLPFIAAAAGRALMKKLLKSGLGRKDSAGLVEQAMGSKAVRDALTKSAKKPKKSSDIGGGMVEASAKNKKGTNKAAAAALASTPSSTGGKKTPTSNDRVRDAIMGSKAVRDALTKKPKYSLPNVAVPSQITMSKGGAVKKMESGGEVRASRKSARKSIDGCAVRGKTRAVRNV